MSGELVLIGYVQGAFGVRGELRIRTFTADPKSLIAYGPLLNAEGQLLLTPKKLRPVTDGVAITTAEVKTREAAEALKGAQLFVPRTVFPEPDEDEFYHVDLIGCRVEHIEGAALGVVRAVQDFGAGELLEIAGESGGVWYLPFTRSAAPLVDIAGRRIIAAERPPSARKDDPEAT
jgi:16S rRNA processing protein RimM